MSDISELIKQAQMLAEGKGFQNVNLAIGIPHSHLSVSMSFVDSFIAMDKPPFNYIRSSAGNIDDMRNGIVETALNDDCTHLIMMDTDQVYHEDTINRLLSHKLPIVGCLVYRRYPPFDPLMFRGVPGKYTGITYWDRDSMVEVDATGTGCLLFDMEVFRRIKRPWFSSERTDLKVTVGEDFYFSARAREAGYKIFVDTSIPCGHLSQMIINEGTWKLYNHVKNAEEFHAVKHGVITNKGGF